MKKYLLLFFVFQTCSFICAQGISAYIVTVNNTVFRKGPGSNFKRGVIYPGKGLWTDKPYANKGDVLIKFIGAKEKNGYVQVSIPYLYEEGWVLKKNLRPAIKCKKCNGTGHLQSICRQCKGEGAGWCCDYTGHEQCHKCKAIGYY